MLFDLNFNFLPKPIRGRGGEVSGDGMPPALPSQKIFSLIEIRFCPEMQTLQKNFRNGPSESKNVCNLKFMQVGVHQDPDSHRGPIRDPISSGIFSKPI